MLIRKVAIVYIAIFMLIAMPMLLAQPSGSASAGLSAGFVAPFGHMFHLVVFCAIGVMAAYLGTESIFLLPVTFVIMLLISAAVNVHPETMPILQSMILGAILLYAIAISMVRSRAFLVGAVISSTIAFHLGADYVIVMPDFANPLYYIVGIFTATFLVIAVAACLALLTTREVVKWILDRIKIPPTEAL